MPDEFLIILLTKKALEFVDKSAKILAKYLYTVSEKGYISGIFKQNYF